MPNGGDEARREGEGELVIGQPRNPEIIFGPSEERERAAAELSRPGSPVPAGEQSSAGVEPLSPGQMVVDPAAARGAESQEQASRTDVPSSAQTQTTMTPAGAVYGIGAEPIRARSVGRRAGPASVLEAIGRAAETPETAAQVVATRAAIERAERSIAENRAVEESLKAALASQAEAELTVEQQELQRRLDRIREEIRAKQQQIDDVVAEMNRFRFDPVGAVLPSASHRISAAINVAAGAMLAVLRGQDPTQANVAAQILDQAIEREVARERLEFGRLQAVGQAHMSVLGFLRERLGDEISASEAMRRFVEQRVNAGLAAIASRMAGTRAAVEAERIIAERQHQDALRRQEFERQQLQYRGVGAAALSVQNIARLTANTALAASVVEEQAARNEQREIERFASTIQDLAGAPEPEYREAGFVVRRDADGNLFVAEMPQAVPGQIVQMPPGLMDRAQRHFESGMAEAEAAERQLQARQRTMSSAVRREGSQPVEMPAGAEPAPPPRVELPEEAAAQAPAARRPRVAAAGGRARPRAGAAAAEPGRGAPVRPSDAGSFARTLQRVRPREWQAVIEALGRANYYAVEPIPGLPHVSLLPRSGGMVQDAQQDLRDSGSTGRVVAISQNGSLVVADTGVVFARTHEGLTPVGNLFAGSAVPTETRLSLEEAQRAGSLVRKVRIIGYDGSRVVDQRVNFDVSATPERRNRAVAAINGAFSALLSMERALELAGRAGPEVSGEVQAMINGAIVHLSRLREVGVFQQHDIEFIGAELGMRGAGETSILSAMFERLVSTNVSRESTKRLLQAFVVRLQNSLGEFLSDTLTPESQEAILDRLERLGRTVVNRFDNPSQQPIAEGITVEQQREEARRQLGASDIPRSLD